MHIRLKAIIDRYTHLLGRELLGLEVMTAKHPQFCQLCADTCEMLVPPGTPLGGQIAPELECGLRRYSSTLVYRIPREAFKRVEVLANGGILLERKFIPNTGISSQRASFLASVQPSLRPKRQEPLIVAPWPHYMNITYGDFLLFVLPRICRVVNRLTHDEKNRAVIAYPLAKAEWEKDYLGKLGFQPEQLVDTRSFKIEPSPDGAVYAPSGEELAWPGCGAHPADYQEARKALWKGPTLGRSPSRRLYLQRNGRRRILNEPDLLNVLKLHNFETIDLGDHSVTDQMAMISNSSIILGAQGANMNSMLWCPEGTIVIEFFNRGFRPAYNYMAAFNLSLKYYYLAQQPMLPPDFSNLNLDLEVDIEAVRIFLARILD